MKCFCPAAEEGRRLVMKASVCGPGLYSGREGAEREASLSNRPACGGEGKRREREVLQLIKQPEESVLIALCGF